MSVLTEVQRTLVKSPPELWTELSNPEALARHLAELGEIRITGVEPETKVEWEAEGASGVVQLKQSGWGTKVTLSLTREAPELEVAEAVELQQAAKPEAAVDTEPEVAAALEPAAKTVEPVADAEPGAAVEPDAATEQIVVPEPAVAE